LSPTHTLLLGETQGDILNNFDPGSVAANGARALLAITMFLTYPMESFVARHVLIKLIHNGDMDGEAAANADEVNSNPGVLCLGRRQAWTLAIYAVALIPSLFLDDLGPVLSITGSLGGSCVSYIAPGLIYLGVHGEEFLAMIAESLDRHCGGSSTNGDIELPVAGDANTVMQAPQVTASSHKNLSKPWWWFPLLMPIWCAIASNGSTTMRETLARAQFPEANLRDAHLDAEDDLVATRRDFVVAIFFVVFGVVAVVAGILSNVYVQLNGIFFTPN
jgi:sodium-coupled neutral amino acid transporter 11